MRAIGIIGLLWLSSCGSAAGTGSGDAAAIADLQKRVAALERQAAPAVPTPAAKGYELLAPALGNERRLYPSEARCEEARNQILSDVAGRTAALDAANGGRRVMVVPPFVSCVPA